MVRSMQSVQTRSARVDYEGHSIEMVDVDENQALAQQYQIMSVPTMIIEQDGKVVDALVGSTTKDDLIQRLS